MACYEWRLLVRKEALLLEERCVSVSCEGDAWGRMHAVCRERMMQEVSSYEFAGWHLSFGPFL